MSKESAEKFLEPFLKKDLPGLKPGDTVKVYQKIKEVVRKDKKSKPQEKERTQIFEGVVIAKKHGKGVSGTLTVRKVMDGVGVERIFPLHLPSIEKIEVTGHSKARQSKLYYLRERTGKKAKLKRKK